jgi:hypothetical protein
MSNPTKIRKALDKIFNGIEELKLSGRRIP